MPREKEGKICPRCGELGSGPYKRWVLNKIKTRYEPYLYFAHRYKKKGKWTTRWCYLGRAQEEEGDG